MTELTSKQLIEQVTEALKGEFTLRSEYNGECYGVIELRTGTTFWVHVDGYGYKDRVRVSACYPKHEDGRGNGLAVTLQRDFDRGVPYDHAGLGEITVSKHKSPARIAKDIENRWLKFYNPLYAQALEYCAAQAAYYAKLEDNKQATTDVLAGLTGYNQDRSWHVEVRHVGSDSTDVALNSLTPDQVKKLAKFLRGL